MSAALRDLLAAFDADRPLDRAQTIPASWYHDAELYALERDPREQTNLWLQQPEVVRRLTALLEKTQADGRSRPP